MDRRKFIRNTGIITVIGSVNSSPANIENNIFKEAGSIPAPVIQSIRNRIKPIASEERIERIARAQNLMRENKMDALFMESGTSLHYFTGVEWGRSERIFGMLLMQDKDPVFISPKFEESRALEQTGGSKVYCWEEDEDPFSLIRKTLSDLNVSGGTMGIEETTRFFVADGIRKAIPFMNFKGADAVTAGCRAVKSNHEIELMQIANDITKVVFSEALTHLKTGMTEREYGTVISKLFSDFGVAGGALVLFGEASAHPHGLVKEVKLKENDIVLMDGGCSVEGYQSDITRTTVFGKPSQKMKDVFDIVLQAQMSALKIAKPGIAAESVDAAARKVIADAGYGPGYKYFTHRLGHGIGMDGHEWYYLVGGSKRLLETGNTCSNEPGIYLKGEFGVRIEDEMLITKDGARHLLSPPASLEKIF